MQYAVKYFYLKSFDMDQPQHSSTWKNTSLFEQQDLMLVAVFVGLFSGFSHKLFC